MFSGVRPPGQDESAEFGPGLRRMSSRPSDLFRRDATGSCASTSNMTCRGHRDTTCCSAAAADGLRPPAAVMVAGKGGILVAVQLDRAQPDEARDGVDLRRWLVDKHADRSSRTAAAAMRCRAHDTDRSPAGLPGQNTKPSAEAPRPTAASASASRVMPQILTKGVTRRRLRQQLLEGRARRRFGHESFADKEGRSSQRAQARQIGRQTSTRSR